MGFRRKDKGGINFTSTAANTHLDLETVKAICGEYKIHNADISLRFDATADDLIDVIEGNRIYMPCIYVVNKIDQITFEELHVLDKLPHYCPVRYWGQLEIGPCWMYGHLCSRQLTSLYDSEKFQCILVILAYRNMNVVHRD